MVARESFFIVQVGKPDYAEEIRDDSAALLDDVFRRSQSSARGDEVVHDKIILSRLNVRLVRLDLRISVFKRIGARICLAGKFSLSAKGEANKKPRDSIPATASIFLPL